MMNRRSVIKLICNKIALVTIPFNFFKVLHSLILSVNKPNQIVTFTTSRNLIFRDYINLDIIHSWRKKLGGKGSGKIFSNMGFYFTKFPSVLNKDVYGYLFLKNQMKKIPKFKPHELKLYTNSFNFRHTEEQIISEIKRQNLESYII